MPANEQMIQLTMWLRYLNIILGTGDLGDDSFQNAKWRVIIAGMKADLQQSEPFTSTSALKKMFPAIPIQDKAFQVSTLTNENSAMELFASMSQQCTQIMDLCCGSVPKTYRELLSIIRSLKPTSNVSTVEEIRSIDKRWSKYPVERAVKYLHDVGEIVRFAGGRLCTRPSAILQIMSNFTSRQEVRDTLLLDEEDEVAVLSKADINNILGGGKRRPIKYQNCQRYNIIFLILVV